MTTMGITPDFQTPTIHYSFFFKARYSLFIIASTPDPEPELPTKPLIADKELSLKPKDGPPPLRDKNAVPLLTPWKELPDGSYKVVNIQDWKRYEDRFAYTEVKHEKVEHGERRKLIAVRKMRCMKRWFLCVHLLPHFHWDRRTWTCYNKGEKLRQVSWN